MIKACIFDLDGTLLYTLDTINYYLNQTLREFGQAPIDRVTCRSFIGNGAAKLIERAFTRFGITDAGVHREALKKYNAAYDANPYYLTEPYPGVLDLLRGLSMRGIKLGVLSNKPDFATRAVVLHFFGSLVEYVQGATEDTSSLKPNPKSTLDMLSAMGCAPGELAFIGDSQVDIKTAAAAGARQALGVAWGYGKTEELCIAGADSVATDSVELLGVILNAH